MKLSSLFALTGFFVLLLVAAGNALSAEILSDELIVRSTVDPPRFPEGKATLNEGHEGTIFPAEGLLMDKFPSPGSDPTVVVLVLEPSEFGKISDIVFYGRPCQTPAEGEEGKCKQDPSGSIFFFVSDVSDPLDVKAVLADFNKLVEVVGGVMVGTGKCIDFDSCPNRVTESGDFLDLSTFMGCADAESQCTVKFFSDVKAPEPSALFLILIGLVGLAALAGARRTGWAAGGS